MKRAKKRPSQLLQVGRKYSFTLMEVMISFSIMSIVLGVIFSSLYEQTLLKTKIERMEKIVMARVEMQQRLDRIFANIIPVDPQNSKSSIYISGESKGKLFIIFDNGIDPDPLFCDKVEGSLAVENNNFVFTLLEGRPNARKSILRKNITKVSYEFLTNAKEGVEVTSRWDEKINYSPSYIKITLNKDEEYVFWVSRPSEGIPLRGGK